MALNIWYLVYVEAEMKGLDPCFIDCSCLSVIYKGHKGKSVCIENLKGPNENEGSNKILRKINRPLKSIYHL